MELLFLPFVLLISVPGLAFAPALLLLWWIRRHWSRIGRARQVLTGVSVLLWFIYAAYETGMYFWMKTVVAPIRVDLLLIVPILAIATVVIVVAILQGRPIGSGAAKGIQ